MLLGTQWMYPTGALHDSNCRHAQHQQQRHLRQQVLGAPRPRSTACCVLRRPGGPARPARKCTIVAAAAKAPAPPRPSGRFSRDDLKRIKQEGPSMSDLVAHHEVTRVEDGGGERTSEYNFVPYEVMGDGVATASEPNWFSMRQMPYMEFYQGLRERNWTGPHYRADAPKWEVNFFVDSGRFMRPSFRGYRAMVTNLEDGSKAWVDMPDPGAPSFLHDYMSGSTKGGLYTIKREGAPKVANYQYGHNQVFEELFAAHEQKVPAAVRRQVVKNMYHTSDPETMPYVCPAEKHLAVSFNRTPSEISLGWFWDALPAYLFYGFAFSFLGVCLVLGIFMPKRQMPSDYAQAMEFAQSKGKARKEGMTNVRFDQVAGIDSVRDELTEIVNFLKSPEDMRWTKLGAKPPKGVLLEGPPGTGKTLIAKAVAGEAGVPFYQMSGSEFVEIIVGVGAARIRDLFKRARVNAPCIIFVDEIDALGIRRAESGARTNEEREQTLNQLLTEIDGFEVEKNPVVFMAATNRADLLDPALLRAGRFDRKIRVLKPDTQGRYDILKVHARKRSKHLAITDDQLFQLAKDLPGLSGAELENVLNESALEAIRQGSDKITLEHAYDAVDRVLQGVRRPPLPNEFGIKRAMAVYESGRAIVADVLRRQHGRLEKVERVSMVPRGSHWTRTVFLRGEDDVYTMTTAGRLRDRLRVILAGRAAEVVAFGTVTTYGIRDLRDAAQLAEKYVASYGLSDAGIVTYAQVFRGMGWGRKKFETGVDNIDEDLFGRGLMGGLFQPSDATVDKIKRMSLKLLMEAYQDNLALLASHHDALKATSAQLLEKEIVLGDELADIIDAHPPSEAQSPETMDPSFARAMAIATGNGNGGIPLEAAVQRNS